MRAAVVVLPVTALAFGAALLYHLSEARRFGARNRSLVEQLDRAQAAQVDLEARMREALAEQGKVLGLLRDQASELAAARAGQQQRAKESLAPMPDGVRLMLVAFNECLRDDGHAGLRFIHAARCEDRELCDAELIERAADGVGSTLYLAGRVGVRLDRANGTLTLRLRDGHRYVDGERAAFAADGHTLTLAAVHGPMWEQRLPALVVGEGEYPPLPFEPQATPRLDRDTHAIWSNRINHLLDRSGTELRFKLDRFDGLENGAFRGVLLLGYGEGRLLRRAIEAARMNVIADGRAGTVELEFHDGTLRGKGGDTKIPPAGYRLLLPGIDPGAASSELFGMVEQR